MFVCVCVCVSDCVSKQTCDCFKANCDPVSGHCLCAPGWTGLRCDDSKIAISLLLVLVLLINNIILVSVTLENALRA